MILLRLVLNILLVLRAPFVWLRRRRAVPKSGFVRLAIDGRVLDATTKRPRFQFPFSQKRHPTSVARVRELCAIIAADPRAKGLVVDLSRLGCGYATALELREALLLVRAANKRLVVQLPQGGGMKEYFVASAGETIAMPPHAMLFLVGMGGQGLYLKGALDKAGVEPSVEQRYEYKSAAEMFSREGMSDAARAQTSLVLESLTARVFADATKGRARDPALLHRGPYRAEEAKAAGLIEIVGFEDKVAEALSAKRPDGKLLAAGAATYLARKTQRVFLPLLRQKRVVVLNLRGTIVDEAVQPGQLAASPVTKTCEALAENSAVGAVVLCVDSRGGSAAASAEMHHAIQTLAAKKPVVAYLSDYAASGGYYIACGADHIVANALSVTGSIGVISMRPVLDGLLAKVGITRDGVRIGDHAGLLDATAKFSPAEQAAMARLIDGTYAEFTGVVMQARKLNEEAVDRVARGRVWLGEHAPFQPLRDAVGGLEHAIAEAVKRAKVKLAKEPVIVEPPQRRNPFSALPFATQPFIDLLFPLSGVLAYEPLVVE